jgi:hypothetical protein
VVGGAKTGGLALRLVLLALLLLGVGVLHTLSHAGAHGGVSASDTVRQSHHEHAASENEKATAPMATSHTPAAVVEPEDSRHSAHADGTTASDCFALIPTGSWLVPPRCLATWSNTAGVDALRAVLPPDHELGTALSQMPALRI